MVLATGADKWNRAARESLNAWNQAGASFRFTSTTSSGDEAASCSSGTVDRRNVVVFASTVCGDSWSATTIAVTKLWYSSSTNVTVDTDVVLNADYDWDVYRGPVRSAVPDFRRVALHEFGHVPGLDHPDDHGQFVDAIMNSRASDLDALQVDDKEGARALYGPSSTVRPDLVVLEAQLSESVASPGERLDITATVQNTGSGRSPVTTLEYLSRRQGGAWELFDVDVVNGLAASSTSTESARFSAPSQPGTYQYQVCVERVDREEDATNNCSRHLTLEVRDDPPDPPDLAVTNLTVSTAELDPRESFVLSAEVVNLGGSTTPPTRLRYRRRSAGRSWTDVGSVSVRSISSGATATRRLDMVAPAIRRIRVLGLRLGSGRRDRYWEQLFRFGAGGRSGAVRRRASGVGPTGTPCRHVLGGGMHLPAQGAPRHPCALLQLLGAGRALGSDRALVPRTWLAPPP